MNKNENKLTNISPILYFSFQTKSYKSNPKNVDLGNLRIKELTLKENATSNSYKKEYKYNDFGNESKSSGLYIGKSMDNDYLETTAYNMPNKMALSKNDFCEYIIVSSRNNFNLYALENKSVVYPNVREKIVNVENNDSQIIDRVYSVPSNVSYSEYELPYITGPYYGYLGGRLLNEIYKDRNNKTVKKVVNNYTFDNYFNKKSSKYNSDYPGFIYPAISVSVRNVYYEQVFDVYIPVYYFNVNKYHYPNTWMKLTSTEEEVFFENNSIKNKTEYAYNYNHIKPIKETISNSKGETVITEYLYPSDFLNQESMSQLVSENRVSEPVVIKQKVAGNYVSEVYNQYSKFNGIIQKSAVFQKKGSGIDITKITDRVIKYDSYDNKGNLTQYTPENGIPVSIIWGYNGQYPVAKIEGISLSQITPATIIALNTKTTDAELLAAITTLRTTHKDAMVTGYLYKPLIGVTKIIQPNGLSENYKYDSANRLEEIRNDKGELLKSFKYNYKQ